MKSTAVLSFLLLLSVSSFASDEVFKKETIKLEETSITHPQFGTPVQARHYDT